MLFSYTKLICRRVLYEIATSAVEDVECGGHSAADGGTTTRNPAVRRLLWSALVMLSKLAVVAACAAAVWYFMGWIFVIQLVLVAVVAYLAAGGGYRWFYVAFKTAPRDLKAVIRYIGLLLQVRRYQKNNSNICDIFRQQVAKHPKKVCFIFEDTEWTFSQVDEYSNKIANVFKDHGFRKGDTVGLLMENRPEYVCIWLGLAKLGVITPLINFNLRLNPLVHSITIGKCQALIFSSEITDAIKDVASNLPSNIVLYRWSPVSNNETVGLGEKNLTTLISEAPSTPPVVNEKVGYNDRLLYIYTSGTTGLPKAAVITHARSIFIVGGLTRVIGFKPSDRFYVALPLYHTAGGIGSIGQALFFGSSVVIRKKFSASAYMSDIRKYECTVGQYIGEMCRYILAVPPKPEDKQHKLRLIYGNGLRPQIWTKFVERFNIPRVAEFYGATEGNANIVNIDNKVGAIGFVSRILPVVYPISIIKVEPETGEPIRNGKGLCTVCKPGEPGVFVGKINPNNPSRAFLGYVNEKESQKKIVYDVFSKGDSAFISGDLLVSDEFGYLYFKDRTGDTFRWKGENVSTSEVEAVISNLIDYRDAVVYGVEVRGMEGRAGMAAIVDQDDTLDLKTLAEGVTKALPSYARPQFIRIMRKVDLTGTFKLKKRDLQQDGFDPVTIKDKLYFMSSSASYETLTEEIYNNIFTGKIRL
ncbi:long-chain fatty acid transport protein 4-like isoform X1 [Periplaneta americana]|uniref:long-chain fatty acid transport protein 4-like isoform X1 n=2 Tax=Periplaneta americana TaxID=6978 RepID=UPI0037E94BDB